MRDTNFDTNYRPDVNVRHRMVIDQWTTKNPAFAGPCGLQNSCLDDLLVEAEGIEPSSENALRAASTGLEQVQFSSLHSPLFRH